MGTTGRILQLERLGIRVVSMELIVLSGVVMAMAVGFLGGLSILFWISPPILTAIGVGALGLVLISFHALLERVEGTNRMARLNRLMWCVVSVAFYFATTKVM